MSKVASLLGKISTRKKQSVVKLANRTDQMTNMMVPLFVALAGIGIGGMAGIASVVVSIPLIYFAIVVPPALSRFSYAAATDKRAIFCATFIAIVSMVYTTVGIVGMGQLTKEIATNYGHVVSTVQKGTDALLSDRVLNKCHNSASNDCVEKDHIQNAIDQAQAMAGIIPPFSVQHIRIGWGDYVITGTALSTILAFLAAASLALIQGFLPFFMAKSNQGTHEEILEGKQQAA